MTPLRQRFIEDMQLRGLAPTTQRSYIHYVAAFAKYFNQSPEQLGLEAIREYELYLLNERKMAPESVNAFAAAIQLLYIVTLEMPWGNECFPRVRRAHKLPVVLSQDEVMRLFEHIPTIKYRAALMVCYGSGLRDRGSHQAQGERYRFPTDGHSHTRGQRRQGSLYDVVATAARGAPLLLARNPSHGLVVSVFLAAGTAHRSGIAIPSLP
jgi:integrase